MCIPFVGQLVIGGWLAAMVQRTARGQEDVLPRLDFDMDYLMKLCGLGFRGLVVQFVWGLCFLPIFIVCYACIGGGAYLGSQLDSGLIGGLLAAIGGLLMIVCMVPFALAAQCGGLRAHLANDIGTGLQFGAAIRMAKAMWKELILGGIVITFVFFGLYLAGMLACGIGVLFTLPIGMVIASNYQAHVARGGEAVNIFHLREADPLGSSVGPRPQAF